MTSLFKDRSIGLLLAVAAFIVYYATMASTVGTEDPGEIATALHGLGVLHPTGYPLFSLLGHVFAKLPFGETLIWRLNLMGALLSAIAVFCFYLTFRLFFSEQAARVFPGLKISANGNRLEEGQIAAIAATVTFAFSAIFWSEAVWLEVYALHLVFLALVTRLFVGSLADTESRWKWFMFAYVLGLSFAHHMMTVLLAPAFLTLFFRTHGFGRPAWTRIASAVPPFVLALSTYLYLPLRAAANPLMNWGDPSTPRAFWEHVRAAQYGDQMFSSLDVATKKLMQFAVDLPRDFGFAPLALALIGLWALRRIPSLLLFTVLIFGTGTLYAINYTFNDPNFNLNAHFMVALWAGFGARELLAWSRAGAAKGVKYAPLALTTVVALIALCPLAFNYAKLDKSRDTLVDDYARNVLASMDSGAVYFSNEYERLGSPAFYLQNVEGFRKDIAVIDIILLGNPWYYAHLEQSVPWLMELARPEIENYRAEMIRFMSGNRDTTAHNTKLTTMFHAIVANAGKAGRPVYVSGNISPTLIDRYQHAPTGMVFRLLDANDTTQVAVREPRYAPLPASNPLTPTVLWDYAQSYAYQGAYRLWLQDTTEGRRLIRKALELKPDFKQAREMLEGSAAP